MNQLPTGIARSGEIHRLHHGPDLGDVSYYATYDVDLEESESNPGLYRVKNPVLNNPNL